MRKDFALCLNDSYVPYACVVIKSIVEHIHEDDVICIHILSDNISDENKSFIYRTASNVNVRFYRIDNSCFFTSFPLIALSWSIYAWYRILLPVILDKTIHKVLYLDCDVLVNDDLDELFSIDMSGKSIAACVDIETRTPSLYERLGYDSKLQYICSGVMLINLDKWRECDISTQIMDFVKNYPEKLRCPDQDAINYVCRNDKIVLPPKYGVIVPYFRYKWFIKEHLFEVDELMYSPAIIHYAIYQPWIYYKNKSMHSYLWWKTYNNLHAYPQVKYKYAVSFIKYWIKVILIYLKVIKPGTKHYIFDLYYYHPRIKIEDVIKMVDIINAEHHATI